jgi:cytochrome c5
MQDWRKKTRILCSVIGCLVACSFAASSIAAQVVASAPAGQQAQIEKGRQVVGQVCAACHTTIPRMIQVHKQSPEQWRDTIYFMISRGAQVMPDEVEPLVAFLSANGGNDARPAAAGSGAGRAGPGRAAQQQMPDGEGRAVFQRACQQCHEAATASNKQPSEAWDAVMARMMAYGAKLNSADQQRLLEYLNGLAK